MVRQDVAERARLSFDHTGEPVATAHDLAQLSAAVAALAELAKMQERTIAGLHEAVRSALARVEQLEDRLDARPDPSPRSGRPRRE